MKLHAYSLDLQMVDRLGEMLDCHCGCKIQQVPGFPDLDKTPPMRKVLQGELTHVMWKKGTLLVVDWKPAEQYRELFKEYGT